MEAWETCIVDAACEEDVRLVSDKLPTLCLDASAWLGSTLHFVIQVQACMTMLDESMARKEKTRADRLKLEEIAQNEMLLCIVDAENEDAVQDCIKTSEDWLLSP